VTCPVAKPRGPRTSLVWFWCEAPFRVCARPAAEPLGSRLANVRAATFLLVIFGAFAKMLFKGRATPADEPILPDVMMNAEVSAGRDLRRVSAGLLPETACF